jgi:hypothetical protein
LLKLRIFFKDVPVKANRKYLLRVNVASASRCELAQVQFVVGYETDGKQMPLEVKGKTIGSTKPKARGLEQNKNSNHVICDVESSTHRIDQFSKVELGLDSPISVTLVDGNTRIPFATQNLLCGVDVRDESCDYSKFRGAPKKAVPILSKFKSRNSNHSS